MDANIHTDGNRVRYYRQRAGKLQSELAVAAEFSQSFLSRIERQSLHLSPHTYARLIQALGVDHDELRADQGYLPDGKKAIRSARRDTNRSAVAGSAA